MRSNWPKLASLALKIDIKVNFIFVYEFIAHKGHSFRIYLK